MTTSLIVFACLSIALITVGILLFVPIKKPQQLVHDPEDFEHTTTVGEFEIFYQDAGQGTPIVFLHGLGASTFVWRYQFSELSKSHRVIIPDIPGFGRSSKIPEAEYDLPSQVDRLASFLDQMKLKKFVLVGSSMGGLLSLALASRLKEQVSHLVLLAPATDRKVMPAGISKLTWASHLVWPVVGESLVRRVMKRVNANPDMITEETVEEASKHFESKEAIMTFVKATKTMRHRSIRSLPESVNTPTLVLYGQKDSVIPRWVVDSLAKRLPKGKLAIHTEGGHHLQEDEHEWTNTQIHEFIQSN